MSYDLTFWRYQKKPRNSALRIYEALMDGSNVEGLDELPIQDICEKLLDVFSDWKLDGDMELIFEKDEEAFQVTLAPCYVRFDCYGKTISYRDRLKSSIVICFRKNNVQIETASDAYKLSAVGANILELANMNEE